MTTVLTVPDVDGLSRAIEALRDWQDDAFPVQLHPGDVGWFWRFGAEATAAALRTWTLEGDLIAVGLLDGPEVLRIALAPGIQQEGEVSGRIAADVADPRRGVLPSGRVSVETPTGALVHDQLGHAGWGEDDPWIPLSRDLSAPVPDVALRTTVVGPEDAAVRADVQRAAFDRSTFTEQRWRAMAEGPPYQHARCVLGYDQDGNAVAATTVWSAGEGRPGLLEPLGVHREHRGHGHGTAIALAGAAALRHLGSSSAVVVTPASNAGALATYTSAGFRALTPRRDRYRPA